MVYFIINMLRTMILTKTHFFPIGATVAIQHEDQGPRMHWVIEKAISSDHRKRSYIIRVTKKGETNNTDHGAHTKHPSNFRAVSMGAVKEGNCMIREYCMQTVPVQHNREHRLHASDPRVHVSQGR